MRTRITKSIVGAGLGMLCPAFAWVVFAVQERSPEYAIGATIVLAFTCGVIIFAIRVGSVQDKAIGRLGCRTVLGILFPPIVWIIGIMAGSLIGGITYAWIARRHGPDYRLAVVILIGSLTFAILGATFEPEDKYVQWRIGARRVGSLKHLSNQALAHKLTGNIVARDFGEDIDEIDAFSKEIASRLCRLDFPASVFIDLLAYQDWAVQDRAASILSRCQNARTVRVLMREILRDKRIPVQDVISLLEESIGTADALAAAEIWRDVYANFSK